MTLEQYLQDARALGALPVREMRTAETVSALVDAGMAVIRQDLQQARLLAKAAVRLARAVGDPQSRGMAARLMGHTELLAGRSKKSLVHYAEARRHFEPFPLEKAATAVAMLQALAYVGDYAQAFAVAGEALETFRAANDPIRAARVEANLANALHRLDRLQEAKAHYEAARLVLSEAEMVADMAIVTRNYGVCLMGLLEFDEAERLYTEARAFFESVDQRSLVLEVDLNRAYLWGRQGRIVAALELYRDLRRNLPPELGYEVGHCFLDQADFLLEYGLWTDAREAALQAAAIFERLGARFELGKSRLIQGIAAVRRRDLPAGREALAESRRLLRNDPNHNWRALLHSGFAELARAQGRPRTALKELLLSEAANPTAERLPFVQMELADMALELGDWATYERLPSNPALSAKFYRLRGQVQEAELAARSVLSAYDARRTSLTTVRLRQAAAQAQSRELRESYLALRHPDERLGVVVRLKNQTLAEMAHAPEALPIVADEQSLREARVHQIARFTPVELPTLEKGERLIELFADSGRLSAFVMETSGVSEFDLGPLESLQRAARMLRFHLGRDRHEGGKGALLGMASLRQTLEPVVGDAARLIIGRDPALLSIPFTALFDDREVTLVPNAATWTVLKGRTPVGKGTIVMGAADDHAPLIEAEADWLVQNIGARRVSLEEFETSAPRARMIHLAAHGIAREDRPMLSSMRFGERSLAVFDLVRLTLGAELVTLSGCSTGVSGVGDLQDIEGFIEAFLGAGASAVLATLWEVSDEAAFHFMCEFYRHVHLGVFLAHRAAVRHTREAFPHPADWAGFTLFGKIF